MSYKIVARCTECEDRVTNGQTCSCGGIVVGYSGDVYCAEGVYYQSESNTYTERRDMDGGPVLGESEVSATP